MLKFSFLFFFHLIFFTLKSATAALNTSYINFFVCLFQFDLSISSAVLTLINFTFDGDCKLVGPEINITFAPDIN